MMPRTLGELLHARASEPQALAYGLLDEEARVCERISSDALYREASGAAAALARAASPGARILLAFPSGIRFLVAFFGCVLAGMIAVPIAPPKRRRRNERLRTIVHDAQPAVVLTCGEWRTLLVEALDELGFAGPVHAIAAGDASCDDAEPRELSPPIAPDAIAYLQYTSGSITTPKGVIVTHANVLSNSAFIRLVEGNDTETVSLTWLPNFHDMGLVEGLLQPLVSGTPGLILPPAAFLRRPRLWLEAITRHRVTNSGAPNLAYDLCVEHADLEAAPPLDLRSWRVAYNGAEPVRDDTLRRFTATFAPCGFQERAWYPVYGLAEATLVVSSGGREDLPFRLTLDRDRLEHGVAAPASADTPHQTTLVASGSIAPGRSPDAIEVAIVDQTSGDVLPDGLVGEIFITGSSVAAGYWNRHDETRDTFGLAVRGRPGRPFARTGDLGFTWRDHLFLTGRSKDLLLSNGRNLYPHDLEWLAETAHDAIQPAGCAAFASATAADRIVVVCELRRSARFGDPGAVAGAVRERISSELDVVLDDVVLIRPGSLPKTSSGKVQRHACRDLLQSGALPVLFSSQPLAPAADAIPGSGASAATDLDRLRRELMAMVSPGRDPRIPDDAPLFEYVNDSLQAVKLCHQVEQRYGVSIPISSVLGRTTLTDLARRIASARTRTRVEMASPGQPGPPRDDSQPAPLSYGQEALWSLAAVATESRAYHIVRVLDIAGPLEPETFRRALDHLAARHAVLRTRFSSVDGVPRQSFDSSRAVAFEYLDLRNAGDDEPALLERLHVLAWRPFRLDDHDSVFRFHLLWLGGDRHLLLIAIHHIAADLWSVAQLLDELFAQYDALAAGRLRPMPSAADDYPEFAAWQRTLASSEEGRARAAVWAEVVRGLPAETALPLDRPRPPAQTFAGAAIDADLDESVTAAIDRVARGAGTTMFGVLLSTYLVFLHRVTGQQTVAVGVPASGRTQQRFARTIGLLANANIIRSDARRHTSWRDVLNRTQAQLLAALDVQDYPFPLVVADAAVPRDPRVTPLFQQMISLESPPQWDGLAPLIAGRRGGHIVRGQLTLRSFALPQRGAQFDLHAAFVPDGRRLLGTWRFNTDLLDEATVRRWASVYGSLLRDAVKTPARALGDLRIDHEAGAAWIRGVDGVRDEPATTPEPTLPELIVAQAIRTPDRVAASCGDGQITYARLDREASAIVCALRRRGLGAECSVAVCLDRSLDLAIVLLGILKSGASYLPISVDEPSARVAQILADARPALVIAADADHVRFGPAVIALSELRREATAARAGRHQGPAAVASGENAAYVIFTSGSTGRPKGAVNTHRGLANRLRWMQRTYGLSGRDRVLQKTPYTFDVSVWEWFWPLMAGAELVIAAPGGHRDSAYLQRLLAEREITVMHFVPSMLAAFLRDAGAAAMSSVRALFCSGEVLPKTLETTALARLPGEIHNLYGPTEAAIDVTAWTCTSADRAVTVPIGHPIANVAIRLLDEAMQPAIPGAAGELCIAGAALARGYAGRPDLTAASFVPDPYAGTPGNRLYRTGDQARLRSDLAIEFLGRRDLQVKVRGFRIELAEIEAQLQAHPDIAAVAVVAHEDAATGTRLIAYIVPRGASVSTGALRSWLADRLPDYMVPARFVPMTMLPRLESGKIDRRSLVAPPRIEAQPEAFVPPRYADEAILADVWQGVLGVAPVGITASFFELGGDSLLILRAVANAKARGVAVTAEDVYRLLTIERVCAALRQRTGPAIAQETSYRPFELVERSEIARLPPDIEDAMPLARLQEAMIYHIENAPNYIAYVASVHLRAAFRQDLFEQALDAALARHPYLRLSFALTGVRRPLQVLHRRVSRPLSVEDVRDRPGAAQAAYLADWLALEKKRRFAWDTPPLFRVTVHRRTDDTFQLTLTEVTLDGWSIAVFLSALCRDYRHLLRGGTLPSEQPVDPPYARFVRLERQALEDRASAAAWSCLLEPDGLGALPRWPARWRSRDRSLHSRRTIQVSAALVDRLQARAREAGAPLKSVCLAAHVAALRTLTGRDDVLTALITHGRPDDDRSELAVGLYTNTVPLRVTLDRLRWIDVVQRVFQIEAERYPHRRYAFTEIHRQSPHARLHETAFNFTHFSIYEDLLADGRDLEVLQVEAFDQTYFTLTAYFNLLPAGSGLSIDLDYNPTELADEQVRAIAGYYERALQAIAESPERTLAATPLLAEEELTRELRDWSGAAAAAAPRRDIMHMFSERCRSTPDRVAVVHGDETITYGVLRRRASRLAARLCADGVGPETGVGVLADRSVPLVVSLLAVLECGGFFVPLDPCDPPDRREAIARQAGLHTILRSTDASDTGTTARLLARPGAAPEALAYCIYTSGSTGVPKGVDVSRGALSSFVQAASAAYGIDEDERVLQFAAPTFDAALEEIFCALCGGATLVLREAEALESFVAFLDACARDAVTLLDLPTAFWHQLTAALRDGDLALPKSVRTVILGGEAALASRLADWYAIAGPAVRIVNSYGPTEATVVSVLQVMEPAVVAEEQEVPIGYPLPGTRAYVVSARGEVGPIGRVGELWLAGRGLARGYRGAPDLTADAFRPDPFATEPGGRVYRTGDLVTRRPDGAMTFAGRDDEQVKVRGFRVELAEIEAALLAHPGISEAAAVVRRSEDDDAAKIVAFIVLQPSAADACQRVSAEAADALARHLPGYMRPTRIERLDALPLTRTGKIDKARLRATRLGTDRIEPGAAPAPLDPVEGAIRAIYGTCLGIDEVPRTARFLELGGDSLSAMKIVNRLHESLRVRLRVRDLFEARTIGTLADQVARVRRSNAGLTSEEPPIAPAAPGSPLEISFAQERLWFLHQFDGDSTSYNVPAAFRLRGPLNVSALHQAFAAICRRHRVLQTHFVDRGTTAEPTLPPVFELPLTSVDLRSLPADARAPLAERIAVGEATRRFDLTRDTLIRLTLLHVDTDDAILVIVLHHIVTDEWCMEIFVNEFRGFYEAAVAGAPPRLPSLPIQYSDYARWQKAMLSGSRLEALRTFWRRELAGAPPVIALPLDVPREQAGRRGGGREEFEIDRSLTRALKALAAAHDASLFMLLLSVYYVLLHRRGGPHDLVVGSAIAGRTAAGTEPLIGFFANLLVLRARTRDDLPFASHLSRVRETTLACYDHQALSFAQLVAALNPERSASYTPIVQVIFGLWPASPRQPRMGGLRLTREPLHGCDAKYDLEMQIAEGGDLLRGFLEYDSALFRRSTIAQLVADYRRLCEGVVEDPEMPLGDLRQRLRRSPVMQAS